eukprot:g79259.t1
MYQASDRQEIPAIRWDEQEEDSVCVKKRKNIICMYCEPGSAETQFENYITGKEDGFRPKTLRGESADLPNQLPGAGLAGGLVAASILCFSSCWPFSAASSRAGPPRWLDGPAALFPGAEEVRH